MEGAVIPLVEKKLWISNALASHRRAVCRQDLQIEGYGTFTDGCASRKAEDGDLEPGASDGMRLEYNVGIQAESHWTLF